MNCDSAFVPKNELTTEESALALIRSVGTKTSLSRTFHTLTDGTGHTSQTDTELIVELLTDGTYTTVREVVDIVDDLLRVDKPDEVLDDGHDILVGQYTYLGIDVETELLIDTIAALLHRGHSAWSEKKRLERTSRALASSAGSALRS